MEQGPLVSIVVIAYNSSKYILETLESIRKQTYGNIELIVADDASKDDTAEVAENWMALHGHTFVSSQVLRSEKNGGIVANCNHGSKVASGAWLKLIAADDMLLEGCIADNIDFISHHPQADVVFSRMYRITEQGQYLEEYFYPEALFGYAPEEMVPFLLHRNYLPSPAAFIRVAALWDMGGFDPAYPMMEDLPLWLKLTQAKRNICGMSKLTVLYRMHEGSVQLVKGKSKYVQSIEAFNRAVRLPMSREISLLLYVTVKVDIYIDRVIQFTTWHKVLYPALWLWAKFSPYSLSRRNSMAT